MLNGSSQSPLAQLLFILGGQTITHCVRAAVELGVPEELGRGPQTVEALAQAVSAEPQALRRILRLLALVGIVDERSNDEFALTAVGELLRDDRQPSLAGLARFSATPWRDAAWRELPDAVRTGQAAFVKAHGRPIFEWMQMQPEQAGMFQRAMASYSGIVARSVVDAYDFSTARNVVDLGGGSGILLGAILEAAPAANATLFDQPHVIEAVRRTLAPELASPLVTVAGDFFDAIPEGADLYVLQSVLHDWTDADCNRILANVRRAMAPASRVLVIEHLLTPRGVPSWAKFVDVEMLVMLGGGKERTAEEFAELLSSARLSLNTVIPTSSPVTLIEAVPA